MAKETMKEKIARLEAEVEKLTEERDNVRNAYNEQNKKILAYSTGTMVPREEFDKMLEDKESTIKQQRDTIEKQNKRIYRLQTINSELSKKNKSAEQGELEQELEECYKRIEEYRKENSKTADEVAKLRRENRTLKAGGEWGNKQLWDEVSRLNKRVKELELKEMDLQGEKEELEQRLKDLKKLETKNHIVKELENKLSRKGVKGIGRKKDIYLEVYLESCIMRGMTAKDIIGSEYQGFDGMNTVKKSTYYKWLKEHKKK